MFPIGSHSYSLKSIFAVWTQTGVVVPLSNDVPSSYFQLSHARFCAFAIKYGSVVEPLPLGFSLWTAQVYFQTA